MKWLGAAGLAFGADFLAKRHLEKTRRLSDEPKELFGGRLLIRRYTNEGAAGEKLTDKPKLVRNLSATAFGAVAAAFFHVLRKPGRGLEKLGLALMTGGGASNFYDRCTREGVTDYLSIAPKRLSWLRGLVFNLADVFIMLGAGLTIFGVLFGKKE